MPVCVNPIWVPAGLCERKLLYVCKYECFESGGHAEVPGKFPGKHPRGTQKFPRGAQEALMMPPCVPGGFQEFFGRFAGGFHDAPQDAFESPPGASRASSWKRVGVLLGNFLGAYRGVTGGLPRDFWVPPRDVLGPFWKLPGVWPPGSLSRGLPRGPQVSQELPRRLPDGHQEASRNAPGSPQEIPGRLRRCPGNPWEAQTRFNDAPQEASMEFPKESPGGSQAIPGRL